METENPLQYPVGRYIVPTPITSAHLADWMNEIERLPTAVTELVSSMSEAQLDTPYRPGGWTARQVVHHMADSHLNSYIRFKWTLTEAKPTIKAYNEKDWAMLPEATSAPVGISINLLTALHARWILMLRSMTEEEMARSFVHPETGRELRLDWMVGLYAWHGRHHLGHIHLITDAS